ncbi:plastocyanin [Colwellia sp. RSH04]|nr:plastocyanin [Colwellia sp. RSH04]
MSMKVTGVMLTASLLFSMPCFAKEVVVEIYKKKFIPQEITIEAGDTVIWKNIEKRQYHNVWFKVLGEEEPGYFFPDETYQRTFNDAGDFPYECGPHPKMTGKVTVKPAI